MNNLGDTTAAFGRKAGSFIERHKSEPWYCYLPFNAVHAPLESIGKYLSRFPATTDEKRHEFCAMDDAIGNVLAKIREQGKEESTLIFFISDNGAPPPHNLG